MRSNISTHIGHNDENKKHIKHSIRIYVGANVYIRLQLKNKR